MFLLSVIFGINTRNLIPNTEPTSRPSIVALDLADATEIASIHRALSGRADTFGRGWACSRVVCERVWMIGVLYRMLHPG